jgi:hypothetical protein
MNRIYVYEIRVEGQLSDQWTDWFDGLSIQSQSKGITILRGPLPDQAALYGVLTKIHMLNLSLISVKRFTLPD